MTCEAAGEPGNGVLGGTPSPRRRAALSGPPERRTVRLRRSGIAWRGRTGLLAAKAQFVQLLPFSVKSNGVSFLPCQLARKPRETVPPAATDLL